LLVIVRSLSEFFRLQYLHGEALAVGQLTPYVAGALFAAVALALTVMLPDGDGIDLIVHMRRLPEYSETPIIVVSVDPGLGRNDPRSSELNVFHWLRKPFDQLIKVLTERAAHDTVHS